jgi:asparagine synthase (glutamine-hydrolysing)
LVSEHCTVALGGDGADELFGGYNHYSKLIKAHNLLKWIPLSLRREIFPSLKRFLPIQYRNYKIDDLLSCDFTNSVPQVAKYFDNKTREKILVGQNLNSNYSDDIFESMLTPTSSILQRATRFDFSSYLCEDILVKVDRTSMLNSLEIRAPFLDYRIIEFAFSQLPDSLRATSRNRKVLLKLLSKKILPKEFDLKRKQGFSIPLDEWVKFGDFRDLFWSTLTDSNSMFDRETIKRLFDEHDRGVNNGERLFALVQLQLWVNKYNVSL